VKPSNINRAARSLRKHFGLFGVRGVIRRATIRLPRSNNVFSAFIPNSTGSVLIRLGTSDVAAFEHVFVKKEYEFRLREKPSIIVDVGANVGMSAVYFSQRYPDARVIAIEPEPGNFDILSRNSERFTNIVPVHAGLWNRDGYVTIRDGGQGNWGMRVSDVTEPSDSLVRALRIQTLLKKYNIQQIDLLKIDAEGAECEILEDFPSWIDRVRFICAELHDRFRPGCSPAFEAATAAFPIKWQQGELCCAGREGTIVKGTSNLEASTP
jgi:FkbM family methyltransferase